MAVDDTEAGRFTPTVSRDSTERLDDELERPPHRGTRIEEAPGFVEPSDESEGEPVPSDRVAVRKTPTAGRDER